MAISQFPASGGGATANNDFVVDINNTANNTAALGRQYISGAYSVSLSSGDTGFDVYLLDANAALVGYSNSSSVVASDGFETVVVLGVAATEVISFTFTGSVSDATTAGNQVAAGAYLASVSPTDLPNADDTTSITGGNFSDTVSITFSSGATELPAKNIVRTNSTSLVVTRPDGLTSALNPWSVTALNPGVAAPTGSGANILTNVVTGGVGVVWTTTSPLPSGQAGSAYAETLVATDADGAVTYSIVSGSFPGLSLNSATGVLSGTPTGSGSGTVRALDQGGNFADREFALPVQLATGGTVSTQGNFIVHTFTASGTLEVLAEIASLEYAVVAGGGGGGFGYGNSPGAGGGGGAGGYRTSVTGDVSGENSTAETNLANVAAQSITITVGAGGNGGVGYYSSNAGSGGASSIGSLVSTVGGGGGGGSQRYGGSSGGSGGGKSNSGNASTSGGSGTALQGFAGFEDNVNSGSSFGGGGGAGQLGQNGNSRTNSGGYGLQSTAAGGVQVSNGGGVASSNSGQNGYAQSGIGRGGMAGAGGGGNSDFPGAAGNPGLVVVRY